MIVMNCLSLFVLPDELLHRALASGSSMELMSFFLSKRVISRHDPTEKIKIVTIKVKKMVVLNVLKPSFSNCTILTFYAHIFNSTKIGLVAFETYSRI